MSSRIRGRIWESDAHPVHARRLTPVARHVLLGFVVVVLGLNWPIMATGVRSIPPIWMGVFRLAGAAVVVMAIASMSGRLRLPPRRDLTIVASLAVFRLAGVTLMVFTALQMIPAGRSSVITWTTPLWTVPLAVLFLADRMTPRRWLGLTMGIAGVVVLFEPWSLDWSDPDIVLGHTVLILAAITNAATSVHIRGHRWTITPLDALPWQLAGASLILLVLGLAVEGPPVFAWTPQLAGVVAYQGVLASGIALWAQIVILRNLEPVSANLTMMGTPAVGVLSSSLLLGEAVTAALVLGLVLIVAGVATNLLSDRSRPDPYRPTTDRVLT